MFEEEMDSTCGRYAEQPGPPEPRVSLPAHRRPGVHLEHLQAQGRAADAHGAPAQSHAAREAAEEAAVSRLGLSDTAVCRAEEDAEVGAGVLRLNQRKLIGKNVKTIWRRLGSICNDIILK